MGLTRRSGPGTGGERRQIPVDDTGVIGDLDDPQLGDRTVHEVALDRTEIDRVGQADPRDPPSLAAVPAPPVDQVDRQRRLDRRVQSLIMTCLTTV
jgi:hypothetical protein